MTESVALVLAAKGTLLLLLAALAALLLPRTAAGMRHAVWTLAMFMLLLLPLATLLPGVRVTVPAMALPVGLLPLEVERGGFGDGAGGPSTEAGSPASMGTTSLVTDGRRGGETPGAQRMHTTTSSLLLTLWMAGVVALLLWLAAGRLALHRVLGRATRVRGEGWDEALRDAAWLLEARQPVRLFSSPTVHTPLTWGVVRPVVVLPADASEWPEDRMRAVLLHEVAHVVRRDCLTQTVASVGCALWWFHPLAWYAAHRMRVERERACDDMVLAAGTAPAEYASHLLELARRCRGRGPAPMLSLHMARRTQLEGRLLAVLSGATGRGVPGRGGLAVAATAALAVTGMVGSMQPVAGSAPFEVAAGRVLEAGTDTVPADDDAVGAPGVASRPPVESEPQPGRLPAGTPPEEPLTVGSPAAAPRPVSLPVSLPTPSPAAVDTPPARTGTVTLDGQDSIARIVPRVPLRSARYSITSMDGRTALLLQDTTLLLQLTDRGLEAISRGDDVADTDRGFLSALLGSMLRGGLRVLLDRGIEYSLRDLREARYQDGRLVLQNVRGTDVFENVNIDGQPLMESFSARDAREFARRVNAARARLP